MMPTEHRGLLIGSFLYPNQCCAFTDEQRKKIHELDNVLRRLPEGRFTTLEMGTA